MEKLIYNPNNHLYLKPRPFVPQLVRFQPTKLVNLTHYTLRLNSVCCKHQSSFNHSSSSPPPPPTIIKSDFTLPDSAAPKRNFLSLPHSIQQKATAAGTLVLLSALLVFVVQPLVVSPALASFQTATKTGTAGPFARSELLSSAWTGFFAGCLHTLSGPDHLAALAPLSIGRSRVESALVGALWGCGHDAGQVIFGLLFLLLKDRLHIEIIRTWGTRVVGLTLLVIGAMGIREASEAVPTPCVALENGECDVSVYEASLADPSVGKKKKKIGFATFATGIIHGLQPDALMMVLPALALPSRMAGAAFLGMFLMGTVIAMGSYTVFIGSASEALKDRIPRITEKLTWISSMVAIALGLGIIISQFFGFSLY
ncbi:chloroplast protein FOR GROWTH AND FERTILITY 2-like [Rutidosis leptorrhynchoides]|uniref:chloroplast protein FOR GROWTH AND FERTILITY 2-like n=1 Tax=Rutidosis leptorrhynchoides TaxID=125765 RepID=UPI003A995E7F